MKLTWAPTPWGWQAVGGGHLFTVRWYRTIGRHGQVGRCYVARRDNLALASPPPAVKTLAEARRQCENWPERGTR